jgi:hypothetical protein
MSEAQRGARERRLLQLALIFLSVAVITVFVDRLS